MRYLIIGRKTYDLLDQRHHKDAKIRLPGTIFELSTTYSQNERFFGNPAYTMNTKDGDYVFKEDCVPCTKITARFYGRIL